MRFVPVLFLALALLIGAEPPLAGARPEFARRESKACGFCHIQPRGGGPRNSNGIAYARNEYRLPTRKGSLNDFKERDRKKIVYVRRMLDLQHIKAALTLLRPLAKSVKGDGAQRYVQARLHELDVKAAEILGQARLFLRGKKPAAGIELLLLLRAHYKGLPAWAEAGADLKDVKKDPALRALLKTEERELKAHLLLLEARKAKVDGKRDRERKHLEQLRERYPDTRAGEEAAEAAAGASNDGCAPD